MSVEMYPTLETLDEKLASLEDPALAERLLTENPALFPSAAAQEEITVFASAWKRFGTLALAATAAASIVAGYVLTPFVIKQAPSPKAAPAHVAALPAPAHRSVNRDAALLAQLKAEQREIARLRAKLASHPRPHPAAAAVPAAAPLPIRHLAPVHVARAAAAARPASAPHVAPRPHVAPQPQTQVDSAAGPEAAPKSSVDTSVATAPAPTTDVQIPTPDGTKPAPPAPPPTTGRGGVWGEHWPAGIGGVIIGRTIDPCTPQGGRIGTVLSTVAGQVLSRAISRGF